MVKCIECGKEARFFSKPNRHMTSPNSARFTVPYCSKECKNKRDEDRVLFFSEIDANCSDCIHFIHDHYEGDVRIGKCKGNEVRCIPLTPMNMKCFEGRY